jgi:hypothetical protein
MVTPTGSRTSPISFSGKDLLVLELASNSLSTRNSGALIRVTPGGRRA